MASTTSEKKKSAAKKTSPRTKLATLKEHWAAGEYREALKLAAGWQRLGPHTEAIQAGWAAVTNPAIYRQMKKDPDALYAVGLAAVATRYKLKSAKPVAATPTKEEAAKVPGVRAGRTRPYLAGRIIQKNGFTAGVTDAMVAELDEMYGKPNATESRFVLKNAWHATRGFSGAGT